MPRAPSWSSASSRRAASLPPEAMITSTPALRRGSSRARLAAREQTRITGASVDAADELGARGQGGLAVEHHAGGLAAGALDARRQQRIVGTCGADAHGHRVALGAPAVRPRAAGLARDPLRVAAGGGHLAVQRHGRLEHHQRPARARVLAEGLVEQARAVADLAVHQVHGHALVAQDAEAAAGRLVRRVVGGHHHACDARLEDRARARRRPAGVGARLQRDVHGGAGRVLPACRQRHAFRVRLTRASVEPLADHGVAAHHHRAHERVGRGVPATVGGQLDAPAGGAARRARWRSSKPFLVRD